MIATTFTGNVPHYDVVASDDTGRHVSVQVKTNTRGSWQFGDMTKYFDISFADKRQIVGDIKPSPIRRLVFVFVRLGEEDDDRFYVLTWRDLAKLMRKHHTAYLDRCGGVRPKRWDSLHCAISEPEMRPYEDRWNTVKRNLR